MDEENIYSGLLLCADCGKPMRLYRMRQMQPHQYSFMQTRVA